jgi:hypothetical protein
MDLGATGIRQIFSGQEEKTTINQDVALLVEAIWKDKMMAQQAGNNTEMALNLYTMAASWKNLQLALQKGPDFSKGDIRLLDKPCNTGSSSAQANAERLAKLQRQIDEGLAALERDVANNHNAIARAVQQSRVDHLKGVLADLNKQIREVQTQHEFMQQSKAPGADIIAEFLKKEEKILWDSVDRWLERLTEAQEQLKNMPQG